MKGGEVVDGYTKGLGFSSAWRDSLPGHGLGLADVLFQFIILGLVPRRPVHEGPAEPFFDILPPNIGLRLPGTKTKEVGDIWDSIQAFTKKLFPC